MSNRKQALKIVGILKRKGFEALFAGGCVRDHLLRRPAKDYDVVTNAAPNQIIPLFRKTLKIGAKFGVIMVLLDGKQVEVATFRTEGGYQDGRHPNHVQFASAKEDASRRDFTINGMFYDPLEKKVLDFVNGRADLKKRIIQTIGDPDVRFSEDFLRLLRAVRFAAQLDFEIDSKTWSAVKKYAEKIRQISSERIAMELEQILTHPNRSRGGRLLIESGLAEAIFAGFSEAGASFGVTVLSSLCKKVDFSLAAAAFWAGVETAAAEKWAKALKLSNSCIQQICFLLSHRDVLLETQMSLAKLKMLLAEPYFEDLMELQQAIQKTRGEGLFPLRQLKKRIRGIAGTEIRPLPLLNGHELIALGAVPGPMVGRISRELYITQLAEEIHTAEQARRWVREWLQKHGGEIEFPAEL